MPYNLTFLNLLLAIICILINSKSTTGNKIQNAVVLFADDGGFEIGAYREKICQTPNLDALAKKSLIFNNAYTSASSCSPSRASLLTGQPSHQNGMYGLHQGVHHFNSFSNIISLPKILQQNGIRTGIIGKKHVGPDDVFKFDYEQTENQHPINQVGRNITFIKLLVREFLQQNNGKQPFFLYVAFHDPHRCGHVTPQYGSYCERWGSGEEGMGMIPDWHPIYYQWDQLELPYYIPDTEPARRDLAARYTTISRLDQGIGLVLEELKNAGHDDDTLIMYTSDNGPPVPGGRTNLYDSGIAEPMFISAPVQKRRNQVTYELTSLLDVAPTLLDWFNVSQPEQNILETNDVNIGKTYTGKSLLNLLDEEPPEDPQEAIFASQTHHEVTMYYPMRAIRTRRYKLIHNLNYKSPFPIDQDLYVSPTFEDILNRTRDKDTLPWYRNLKSYYNRPEWELYDVKHDPEELRNLIGKPDLNDTFEELKTRLHTWQQQTNDPWRCAPHFVLMDTPGITAECLPLYN
uniref:Putative sulfatase n=1 Tax=Xenopsylla cheopis TaxID=163159 RepID=A0A6M2DWX7_XENCH